MARTVSDIRIRFATADDAGLLLQLIRQLAAYERAPNAVTATEEALRRYGFGPERQFEALLAFLDGEPSGLALFHPRVLDLARATRGVSRRFVSCPSGARSLDARLATRS
jgi:hypothetical protein